MDSFHLEEGDGMRQSKHVTLRTSEQMANEGQCVSKVGKANWDDAISFRHSTTPFTAVPCYISDRSALAQTISPRHRVVFLEIPSRTYYSRHDDEHEARVTKADH